MAEEAKVNEQDEVWVSLGDNIQKEIENTQRELRDIGLMLEQSQVEVDKLSQRNATITMHLQQVESKLDAMPVAEIQNAYNSALDAQQRLVVMRSQLEKLQSDQNHLDRYLKLLKNVKTAMEGGDGNGTPLEGSGKMATAEMMIQAQETERQRLSRQIHDGPAQTLSNFILQTEIAMRLFDVDQDKARDELANLKNAASNAFQQVRDFIFDLRPMMLDDLGLGPTFKKYEDVFREKSNLDVNITVTGTDRRLESYLEVMVFRTMQELMKNAAIHSQATQIKVQLDMGIGEIKLVIEDNGRGFDPNLVIEEESGLGLKLIRERVEMLGGEFAIDSTVGEGARITLTLPAAEVKE
ncbi:MAG: sensor histidine kinase [Anaerolineales bacterium]|jgi:two-component system sensor histidine kinase DegS